MSPSRWCYVEGDAFGGNFLPKNFCSKKLLSLFTAVNDGTRLPLFSVWAHFDAPKGAVTFVVVLQSGKR